MKWNDMTKAKVEREWKSEDEKWCLNYYPMFANEKDVYRLYNYDLGIGIQVKSMETAMRDYADGLKEWIAKMQKYIQDIEDGKYDG